MAAWKNHLDAPRWWRRRPRRAGNLSVQLRRSVDSPRKAGAVPRLRRERQLSIPRLANVRCIPAAARRTPESRAKSTSKTDSHNRHDR
jgi:hypothetical protein